MSIENLKSFDPFADEGDPFGETAETVSTSAGRRHKSSADVVDPLHTKASDTDELESSLVSFPYEDETADVGSTVTHLHIRIQQRNGRKTLTTLQGLSKEYDEKKLLKAFKKEFACNGTVIDDEKAGKIIQLQGDHRSKITNFLVDAGVEKATIKVHGF